MPFRTGSGMVYDNGVDEGLSLKRCDPPIGMVPYSVCMIAGVRAVDNIVLVALPELSVMCD